MAVLRVEATVMQVQGLLEDGLEHVVGHDGTLAVQRQVLEGRQVLHSSAKFNVITDTSA